MLAPAKINLDLLITAKRDDGYHLLDSLVVFADFGDELTVEEADHLSIEISGPFARELSHGDDNLVLKAAKLFCQECGEEPNLKFHLVKNLPVSSGIGGGSADAAAALKLCIDYYSIDIGEDDLKNIALKLGADVPVCLKSTPVQMTDIGDGLKDFILADPLYMVLVNPGVSVSTPEIFKQYSLSKPRFNKLRKNINSEIHLPLMIKTLKESENSLQVSAISVEPRVKKVLNVLEQTDDAMLTRMSGSGATCFAIYNSNNECKMAVQKIKDEMPKWWVKAVKCS